MLIAVGVLVAATFAASAIAVARERTWWSLLQLLGAGLLPRSCSCTPRRPSNCSLRWDGANTIPSDITLIWQAPSVGRYCWQSVISGAGYGQSAPHGATRCRTAR